MILGYLNFPMLNPHRQVGKYGPHLSYNSHTKSMQSPRQSQRAWTQPDSLRES